MVDEKKPYSADVQQETGEGSLSPLVMRSVFGGVLMGLANLVPGISGGTMLLAAGVYPKFVQAVAEVTRLKFRYASLVVLASVGISAILSILLLAGVLKDLVLEHRWVMYSLFIGLTLGGIPIVWKLARPASTGLVVSALFAFTAMVALAVAQAMNIVGNPSGGTLMFFVAGLAGASAMILPGISGGYLLLLLGQYVPILAAIDAFKEALKARDIQAALGPAFSVVLPVGLGVLIGIALVGNLLGWLLKNHAKATLGALLGLLIGSAAGLWPFQVGIKPRIGDMIKGQAVTAESVGEIEKDDWPVKYFRPSLLQVVGSLALIATGFGVTTIVAKVGGDEEKEPSRSSDG